MLKSAFEVHTEIAATAAWNANRDIQQSPFYTKILADTLGNEVFKPNEGNLEHSISLTWDSVLDQSPPEVIDELHRIGKQAIMAAIVQNKEQFVGLIVGHAKKGNNYFDVFKT